MHLYLPRRHRRKLLFPSGLLALAGLLWLGCMVVNTWREQLKIRSVMQLTMPLLHATPGIDEYVLSPEKFTACNAWHDTYFNGPGPGDSLRAIGIAWKATQMQADPLRDQRLRVRLGPKATYTELVFLLNTMTRHSIPKYALDIKHRPTTFYAFTINPYPRKKEPAFKETAFVDFCGTRYYQTPTGTPYSPPGYWSVSYFVRFGHWLAALFNPALLDTTTYTAAQGTGEAYDVTLKLERQYLSRMPGEVAARAKFLLLQSEWRIPLMLIGVIVLSSCWQLKHQLRYH